MAFHTDYSYTLRAQKYNYGHKYVQFKLWLYGKELCEDFPYKKKSICYIMTYLFCVGFIDLGSKIFSLFFQVLRVTVPTSVAFELGKTFTIFVF